MSQQLLAACCCGDVEPPPPPQPSCPGQPCQSVLAAGQDPDPYYTVTNAGWSILFSLPYLNDSTLEIQNFEFTVTIPAETFNYFSNEANTPAGCPWPVPQLVDFSGPLQLPNREPYWEQNFTIERDLSYDVPDTCKHNIAWSFRPPSELAPPDGGPIAEWYLYGPDPLYVIWTRIAPNNCTRRPHAGTYQVETVGYSSGTTNPLFIPFENGTCTSFEFFGATGEVCISATPVVVNVRECG